ncbi:MAG: phospholipase D-like domain-containing protein [Corticimicrobacter sp.]|uniref:phospholipase D-like domain-containing protein n=1 Tax=Corticimicrobacter sp. TaxID=2678536 RepID=UPI0032DB6353
MDTLRDFLAEYWPHLAFLATFGISAVAAVHAAMSKRDVRAAIGWVAVILFSPLFGTFFYLIAGINRIRQDKVHQEHNAAITCPIQHGGRHAVTNLGPFAPRHLWSQKTLGDHISGFPLLTNSSIQALDGGPETYPAMLAAIRNARHSVAMTSYIFDCDAIGKEIAEALIDARKRGLEVRVLIDAIGARYSHPPITSMLLRGGVQTALFMNTAFGLRLAYANLRSHRKIMIIDGTLALTGGMNIREEFITPAKGGTPARDAHFRLEGPIVSQLMHIFAQDWKFSTHETLEGPPWFPEDPPPAPDNMHPTAIRVVASGPDQNIGSTHNMILGALAVAERSVRIHTPYFLPDQPLIAALNTAARRGIAVDIVIPSNNNLRMVDYAMTAQLDQILGSGCRVWRAHGIFDHAKLLTVDGAWSYVGTSNLDPRSLRLNFEVDMEVYDPALAAWITRRIDGAIAQSSPETLETLRARPRIKQLRNRLIWLASPYL